MKSRGPTGVAGRQSGFVYRPSATHFESRLGALYGPGRPAIRLIAASTGSRRTAASRTIARSSVADGTTVGALAITRGGRARSAAFDESLRHQRIRRPGGGTSP